LYGEEGRGKKPRKKTKTMQFSKQKRAVQKGETKTVKLVLSPLTKGRETNKSLSWKSKVQKPWGEGYVREGRI